MRSLRDEAQEQELAIVRRQLSERAGEREVAGSFLADSCVDGDRAPAAPAQLVGDAPLRDREEPRPHRARRRTARERSRGVDERLLRQLLGGVPVAQPAENEGVDVAAKSRERVFQSSRVG